MKTSEKRVLPDGSTCTVPKNLGKLLNLNYLRYTNKTHAAGKHDLPSISCNPPILPDYLALYNHPGDYHHTALTGVCFFLYDDTFDGQNGLYNAIYYNNQKRLNWFRKRFRGIRFFIMPDISQCGDVDDIENHYRLKKMRIIALWLTMDLRAVVIPFITFPTLKSIDFALDGYEDCSTVCFSTMGYIDNPIEREVLRESIHLTVDNLNLCSIVVFDVCRDNRKAMELFSYAIEHNVRVHIPMNMLKERNIRLREASNAQ